ncbi:MAG: serine hydrolase [Acidobacteriota bacterium]
MRFDIRRATAVGAALVALACSAPPPTAGDTTTGATASGDASAAAADALVAQWVEAERIPGAVLLISRDGKVTFDKAYGFAQRYEYGIGEYGAAAAGETRPDALRRLDPPLPMGTATVFDLASVTKVMATTFAVMLLVDEGALELDAPVSRYLPDFGTAATDGDGAAAGPPGKRDITLRELLTHRAGLSQWQPIYYSADDADDAYTFIRDFPLAWAPGAGRHYSDLGFMLLGILVQKVSGQSLDSFLNERLYGPLGLSATGFRPVASGSEASTSASGSTAGRFAATSHGNPFEQHMVHEPDFGYDIDVDPDSWDGWRHYTLVGEVNDGNAFHAFGGVAGHAGLFSTAADLQVLLQLLLNRGEYGGTRYLSAATVDEFLTSAGDGQALGWQVPEYLPAGSFAHPGFTGTYVAGIPAQDTAIVLLTNRQNGGLDEEGQYPNLGELQREVARAVTGTR